MIYFEASMYFVYFLWCKWYWQLCYFVYLMEYIGPLVYKQIHYTSSMVQRVQYYMWCLSTHMTTYLLQESDCLSKWSLNIMLESVHEAN